jgi:hypothetical protein
MYFREVGCNDSGLIEVAPDMLKLFLSWFLLYLEYNGNEEMWHEFY